MMFKNWKEQVDREVATVDFQKNRYAVCLETSKGKINVDLFPDLAPNHCKNMIGLARAGFYDGLSFHRIVRGFVIQGGCPNGNGTGGPGYRVGAEFNDRKHEFGVLSMARTQDPNSAGSQFFICLDSVPYLDGQYTVFGKIAEDGDSGNTVRAIGSVETGRGDVPVERVSIYKATVTETPL
jgi:peptidyl-prolyl cis-trans isomerase B (cyclophilin B)